jgi:hypothetical protein
MRRLILLLTFLTFGLANGQEKELPFAEIGPYPENYSAQGVLQRLISGLGYRFYWASADLRPEDLNYRPSNDSRATIEILKHIHQLSTTIATTLDGSPVESDHGQMNYQELREGTLNQLQRAVSALDEVTNFSELSVKIVRPTQTYEFPFWHLINGQISDALWHCGQVVMNRRASGNPLKTGVNVFLGRGNF